MDSSRKLHANTYGCNKIHSNSKNWKVVILEGGYHGLLLLLCFAVNLPSTMVWLWSCIGA